MAALSLVSLVSSGLVALRVGGASRVAAQRWEALSGGLLATGLMLLGAGLQSAMG